MNGTFFAFGFLMKGGFLTATVSDLPKTPKSRFYQQKIFLAFTIPGFWLLLFGRFGFYYTKRYTAWS